MEHKVYFQPTIKNSCIFITAIISALCKCLEYYSLHDRINSDEKIDFSSFYLFFFLISKNYPHEMEYFYSFIELTSYIFTWRAKLWFGHSETIPFYSNS